MITPEERYMLQQSFKTALVELALQDDNDKLSYHDILFYHERIAHAFITIGVPTLRLDQSNNIMGHITINWPNGDTDKLDLHLTNASWVVAWFNAYVIEYMKITENGVN